MDGWGYSTAGNLPEVFLQEVWPASQAQTKVRWFLVLMKHCNYTVLTYPAHHKHVCIHVCIYHTHSYINLRTHVHVYCTSPHRAKHPTKVHVWVGISLRGRSGICIFDERKVWDMHFWWNHGQIPLCGYSWVKSAAIHTCTWSFSRWSQVHTRQWS